MSFNAFSRNKVLLGLVVLLFISVFMNWRLWTETRKLKQLSATQAGVRAEDQKLKFIRFFFENYALNSLEGNQLKQQRLTRYMTDELKKQTLADLERIQSRTKKNFVKSSQEKTGASLTTQSPSNTAPTVQRITFLTHNQYQIDLGLNSQDKMISFLFSLSENSDATADYPFLVSQLEYWAQDRSQNLETSSKAAPTGNVLSRKLPQIYILPDQFSVFEFNCSIDSVSVNPKDALKFKMSNLDVTELHLHPLVEAPNKISVDVRCAGQSYTLQLEVSPNKAQIYTLIDDTFSSKATQLTNQLGSHSSQKGYPTKKIEPSLDRKIKSELGFIIED